VARGDLIGARRHYAESLSLHVKHRDRLGIVKCLEGLVCVLVAEGQHERAARLLGSAEQMRSVIGAPRTSVEMPAHEQCVTRLQGALGLPRYDALVEEGRGEDEERVLARVGQPEGSDDGRAH
jgi:hypothetical protein